MDPRKLLVLMTVGMVAVCLFAASARAQQVIFSVDSKGVMSGDWSSIQKCADRPFAALDKLDYRRNEWWFQTINSCRLMLTARHSVWIELGHDPAKNPYPPIGNMPDDFKHPLKCADAAATTVCELDRSITER